MKLYYQLDGTESCIEVAFPSYLEDELKGWRYTTLIQYYGEEWVLLTEMVADCNEVLKVPNLRRLEGGRYTDTPPSGCCWFHAKGGSNVLDRVKKLPKWWPLVCDWRDVPCIETTPIDDVDASLLDCIRKFTIKL